MEDENKKDLLLGMLYAFVTNFEIDFTESQRKSYEKITKMIEEIYYPSKVG